MHGTEYASLASFTHVAQERSFRRAAARLGVSPSALSHSIRDLEERIGTRLLHRTTRSVSPTEAGQALLDRLLPAFADIGAAVDTARALRDRPSGTVRLNVPRDAARLVLAPIFGRFTQAYPDVRLEVIADDGLVDIVAGGFDAGIRIGERVERDMIAVQVTAELQMTVVGTQAYLDSRPQLHTPRDLKDHACIGYRQIASGTLYRWAFARGREIYDVAVEGPLILNDPDLMVQAAIDGVGLACCLDHNVIEYVAAGRLVRVLEDWCPVLSGFFLYYPGRRQTLPALRALVDFLRADGSQGGGLRRHSAHAR